MPFGPYTLESAAIYPVAKGGPLRSFAGAETLVPIGAIAISLVVAAVHFIQMIVKLL